MTAREPRNHLIDTVRAASVLVVVVFHSLLYQVRLVDGWPVVNPWGPPAWPWWFLSWFFMVMPIFFLAGGFAQALLVDRMRREGTSYGLFLANRGRRLASPLVLFITIITVLSTVAAWAGLLDTAVELTRALMQLLWFIAVYLVIVAISPAALRAQDRWGWRPMLLVFAAAAGVDAWSFAVGVAEIRMINMVLVWPLVHQFGIAYQRGWFRRGPAWHAWAPLGAGIGGICLLVFALDYPGSSVGLADIPIANVLPPTVAMVFLALAQAGALGLAERAGVLATLSPKVARVLQTVNALMMTVYLWHIACIVAAAAALLTLSSIVPAWSGFLLAQPTVALASVALVALIVPQLGRLEYRLIAPLGEHQDPRQAVIAYAVLVAGVWLVWGAGTVLHPSQPESSVGVGLVWAGSWLMRRAANSRTGTADALTTTPPPAEA